MLRAKTSAMSGASAVTVPTWQSGSSYLRRANTNQTWREGTLEAPASAATSDRDSQLAHGGSGRCAEVLASPDRVPHDLDLDRVDARLPEQKFPNVVLDHAHRRAAHRGVGDLQVRGAVGRDVADRHDQTHVDEGDGYLGVLDMAQGTPD